jgi:hypothetical protein
MSLKLPFRYDGRTMDPQAGPVDPTEAERLADDLDRQADLVARLRRGVQQLARLVRTRRDREQ